MSTSEIIKNDSIVLVTPSQLKYANLLFIEHKRFLEENKLLNQQILNYRTKIDYMIKTDSLRISQIDNYQRMNRESTNKIKELNSDLKKKQKILTGWKIGGITVSAGLILSLLLK